MGWMLALILFLIFLPILGLTLRGLLNSGVFSSESGHRSDTTGPTAESRPSSPAFVPGSREELFHHDHLGHQDDLLTNPIYSHLPASIFHSLNESNSIGAIDMEIDSDSGPDYITDPIYSYMPCNIYYSNDLHDPFDDSFGIASTTTSSFDDDLGSSSTGSLFDDDWSSSFSDDHWSSSSFDD